MGWFRERLKAGQRIVPVHINLALRMSLVLGLSSVYIYSQIVEQPGIFYHVRERRKEEENIRTRMKANSLGSTGRPV